MQISKMELAVIVAAINVDANKAPRIYGLKMLKTLSSAMRRIRAAAGEDLKLTEETYVVDFDQDERKLIINTIETRGWAAGDADNVLSAIERLSEKDAAPKSET